MTTLQHVYQLAMEAGNYATRLSHHPAPGNISGLSKAYAEALDRLVEAAVYYDVSLGDWNSMVSIAQGRD